MPTPFEDRERGFEAKFAYDEEQRFRLTARRDKLFAAWVAADRKLSATDAQRLQDAVLAVPGGADHDAALLGIAAARGPVPGDGGDDPALRAALAACAMQAAEQLARGVA